jgi:hypothetical protein
MTRLKALDMGYKIKNLYPSKNDSINETPTVVNVIRYGNSHKN